MLKVADPWSSANAFPLLSKSSVLPAVFTQELKDQKALEKESVTWSCELSKPGIPVQWRKGKIDLCSCAKYEFRQDCNLVQLIIHDVDPEDSGDYTCDCGDQKTTAHLEVKGRTLANLDSLYQTQAQQGLYFIKFFSP